MSRLKYKGATRATLASIALVLLLALSVTAYSNASAPSQHSLATAPSPKDETVFVNLESDGSVREVNIVNTFRAPTGPLLDYGMYSLVTALGEGSKITLSAGRVDIVPALSPGIVRYQGRLLEATLPWLFSFTYYLDGQQVEAGELLGVNGRLSISLSIRPNPLAIRHFSDHYTLQAVIPLWVDRVSDVEASGATAMLVGSRLNLAFTVMPGESHHQVISATVRDFAMPGIEMSAMRLARPQGAWLEDLDQGFAGLTGGLEGIIGGTTELEHGLRSLHAGVGELSTSLAPLAEHAEQFTGGLQRYATSVDAFGRGLTELYEGQVALNQGSRLAQENLPALQDGYNNIARKASEVVAAGAAVRLLAEPLVGSADSHLRELAEASLLQLAALEALAQSLAQANAGLAMYAEGVTELASQQGSLTQGLSQAAGAAQSLTAGIGELSQGATELMDAVGTLPEGIKALHSQTSHLPQHVRELATGQKSVARGLAQAQGRLLELLGGGPEAPVISFASPERASATSVQFVLVTMPVQATPAPRIAVEPAPATGLWQRLLKLAERITTMLHKGTN